jgi:macrolide-specific efflux system membrane fusion protein
MKLKILAIVALAAVGLGAACVTLVGLPATAASTTQYLTGAVTTGDVTDDVAATGTVATSASYGLSFGTPAHLAGATAAASTGGSTTWTATKVDVKVGDTVKKGDVLATADTTDLHRQYDDATVALSSANIELTIAQEALDAATTTDVTRQATMNYNKAKTAVSDAKNARTELATAVRLATLTAPIDGIVTSVGITAGFQAPSGDAVVIDATSFQITADVVESDLKAMAVGQAATISIGAVDATVQGKVTAIAPTTTGSTTGGVVSYPVTVSIDNPPATVRAGMTADVTITIDSVTNVLTVPAAALRGTAGAYTVLTLDATGTPVAQPVQVGLVTNTTAEIKGGLTAGQQVVTGVNTAQTTTTTTTGGGAGGLGGGLGVPGGGGGRPRTGN